MVACVTPPDIKMTCTSCDIVILKDKEENNGTDYAMVFEKSYFPLSFPLQFQFPTYPYKLYL